MAEMAAPKKRTFTVGAEEQAVALEPPTPQQLEREADAIVQRFIRKHGDRFPRLVAALLAEKEPQ